MPEAAFFVGQLGRYRSAIEIDDTTIRIAVVLLFDGIDQSGGDVRSGALHNDRNVLICDGLEREQRFRGLRLVVEADQLELAAERTSFGVDVVDNELHLLQVLISYLGKRPGQGVGI